MSDRWSIEYLAICGKVAVHAWTSEIARGEAGKEKATNRMHLELECEQPKPRNEGEPAYKQEQSGP